MQMADPALYSEPNGDTGTPRWVKIFGIIALVLVLLVVIMMFIGGGDHGPGRHISSGNFGAPTPPSTVTEHGMQQP
jgi:hypothetical protein